MITEPNTAWVCAQLCNLPKPQMTKFTSYFSHGRWFSPGTLASFTTKTCRHDVTEILLKVMLNTKNHHNHYHVYIKPTEKNTSKSSFQINNFFTRFILIYYIIQTLTIIKKGIY